MTIKMYYRLQYCDDVRRLRCDWYFKSVMISIVIYQSNSERKLARRPPQNVTNQPQLTFYLQLAVRYKPHSPRCLARNVCNSQSSASRTSSPTSLTVFQDMIEIEELSYNKKPFLAWL